MLKFKDVIETHRLRMQTPHTALRVWNQCLTEEERNRLGDLETAYRRGGTVGIWAEAKRVSPDRATIELARSFGLPEFDYQELLAVIAPAEVAALKVPAGRPVWNRKLGQLSLNGKVIRRVSGPQRAKNIVAILDAFEAHKWPVSIKTPKSLYRVTHDLGQTVKSLNRKLEDIRFERDGSASGVCWRARNRRDRARARARST